MKELRFPETENPSYIDISEITDEFSGLIIGYKNEKPVGYFQYLTDLETWYFMTSISDSNIDPNISEIRLLIEAIKIGLKLKIFDKLKVIEFE